MFTKTIAESVVKTKVKRLLSSYTNVLWVMPQAGVYGKRGTADFICCVNGRYLEIETKRDNAYQTPLQKQHEQKVMAANGIYCVIVGVDGVSRLRGILKKLGATLRDDILTIHSIE